MDEDKVLKDVIEDLRNFSGKEPKFIETEIAESYKIVNDLFLRKEIFEKETSVLANNNFNDIVFMNSFNSNYGSNKYNADRKVFLVARERAEKLNNYVELELNGKRREYNQKLRNINKSIF